MKKCAALHCTALTRKFGKILRLDGGKRANIDSSVRGEIGGDRNHVCAWELVMQNVISLRKDKQKKNLQYRSNSSFTLFYQPANAVTNVDI